MRLLWSVAFVAAISVAASAAPAPQWRLTRNSHFEIYSQSSDQRALAVLRWFEQLRVFFEQQGATAPSSPAPVRVLIFASDAEYQPYRLRPAADAYFVGNGSQNYIVMGTDDPGRFRLAAHEYAHLVLRDSYLHLAPWLKEGISEFFATLHIAEHGAELGGALPARIHTLQTRTWIPLAELISLSDESQRRMERFPADLFYAESWALTEMLMLSPKYAPRFRQILASPALDIEAVARDLHNWLAQPRLPVIQLPEINSPPIAAQVSPVSPPTAQLLLAQLLLAADEFDRAQAIFSGLDDTAAVSAGLGMIALKKGDSAGARRSWKHAIDQGITDATLCYRYAILADQAGLPAGDIRPALERAIALQPDLDDAHYQLALLEKNASQYEAAIREFQAMRNVSETRAYAYWLALADTYNELGRRDDARSAGQRASEHAATPEERSRAAEQIYIAQTDPGVQFTRDASGRMQLAATRMPHETADWNPFIEPDDDIRRIQGALSEIECGQVTAIRVRAAGKLLTLTIPDLQHVQMRHSPPEFVCGPQPASTLVMVDYARSPNAGAEGIVRGMDFHPAPASPAAAP